MIDIIAKPIAHSFPHGAEWVQADFHLHTIKDMGSSRKKFRAEFSSKENDFPLEFVQRLKDQNVQVGAITNHNSFDLEEYQTLTQLAIKKGIFLLPGVELGVQGGDSTIHTLVVFDPSTLKSDNNFIDTALKILFPRHNGKPKEGDATDKDLSGCLDCLEGLKVDYFLVFAHVESDNGLLKDMKKTVLEPVFKNKESIWKNRVLGFEKVGSDENWVRQKLPEAMPIPAFVNGSDPRDSISEVGQTARGKCFLKLSDLSFHSVQFALKESAYRVCRDLAQTKKRPLICSLEIKTGGGKFWAYQLSSNLNTLIGSRGSGKSLMIEILRWGLGLDAGEGDSRYKREMLDYWLKRGGEVTINGINEHGDTARITRAYTEKTNPAPPQVWVNDQESKIAIGSIFPGLLYFGQKDLGERQETFNETFFAQLLGVFPENLGVKEDRAATAFKKTIDSFLTASKAKSQDDELKYEQESLRKKLEVFKQHGVEPRLKEITDFDQDVRRFRSFKKHYEESFAELDAEITSWVSGFAGIEIFKAAVTESFRNQFDVVVGKFSEAKARLEQGRQSASAIAMLLNELNKALESKRQELQAQFAGILREVEAPDLNIDAYRTMVSRYEQIVEIRRLSEEQGGRTSRFEKEMLAAGEAWHQAKLEITAFYQAKIQDINQNLPASLRLSIDPQADRDDFRSFLESIFRGARFNETSYESILDCCQSGLEIYKRRKQIAETELTPGMAEIFNQKLDEKFKDILTFLPKDRRAIRYDEAYISELSLGKRAMALLLLLLSLDKHAIILLDQPEDDLDNETIHRMVVQPLLKKKESIQFIIATHNPNIPVLGDAEQVIACEEASRGELKHDITGSLDKNSVKDAIVKIMEGGQEAFDKRHDIYTLWKNSN